MGSDVSTTVKVRTCIEMPDSQPTEYTYLKDLLEGMESNLSKRMDRFEENVNKRLDHVESKMAEYVLKAVFESELRHIREEVETQRALAEKEKEAAKRASDTAKEAAKREASQRVTWWIALGGVAITAVNVLIQVLLGG